MPRAPADSDVFNAIAEPRRRAILDCLAPGRRSVNQIVEALELPQPTVSKHLRVLSEVGLVSAKRAGRRRLYRVNPQRIRAVHDWTRRFETHSDHRPARLKPHAEG